MVIRSDFRPVRVAGGGPRGKNRRDKLDVLTEADKCVLHFLRRLGH